jgi:hypothetical protein
MDTERFKFWLNTVVDCPADEVGKKSSCGRVVNSDWTTLLGWGNWDAKVVFVGANPLLSSTSAAIHAVSLGGSPYEHAYRLSLKGFEREPHFRYHRAILKKLRERDARLAAELPGELEYFAFCTEIAFCATRSAADLPPDVPARCFRKNVLPFIREAGFRVIVAVGREAAEMCVDQFAGAREADGLSRSWHGRLFRGADSGPWVITSYHPNARGSWDRAAVADRLFELFDRHGVALG